MPDDLSKWEFALQNSKYIVKIQSLYRGFRDRKMVQHLKKAQRSNTKYFTREEGRETLSPGKANGVREKRPKYTFKTGAVYTGEWKGGLRDGEGT
jgi:hypothetical protein